jgi:hypothetical protein
VFRFAVAGDFHVGSIVADASGVYLGGTFINEIELDGVEVLPNTDDLPRPAIVALTSASGALQWAKVHTKMSDGIPAPSGTAQDLELAPDGRLVMPVHMYRPPVRQRQIVRMRTNGTLESYVATPGVSKPVRNASDASGRHVVIDDVASLWQVLPSGAVAWSRSYPGVRWYEVAEAAAGAIVSGGNCVFGPCNLGAFTAPDNSAVIAKHSAAGAVSWVHSLAPHHSLARVQRVAVDAAGSVHATVLGNGAFVDGGTTFGVPDQWNLVLVELTSAGALSRVDVLGTASDRTLNDVGSVPFEDCFWDCWDYLARYDDLALSPNGARLVLDDFSGTVSLRDAAATSQGFDLFVTAVP